MFFFRSRDANLVCGSLDLRRCQSRGQEQARVAGWGFCWGKSVPLSLFLSTFRVAGPERRTWRHQGCKYTLSPPQPMHLLSEMYPSNQQSVALSHTDRRTQRTAWPSGKKGKDPLLRSSLTATEPSWSLASWHHTVLLLTFRDLLVNKDPEVIVVTREKR